MLTKQEFTEKVQQLVAEVRGMTGIDDPQNIAETAARLKGLNYAPPVGGGLDTFLSYTTSELAQEIERLAALPDDQVDPPPAPGEGVLDIKLQQISVLVFYFRELAELRRGVPEAWDEIDELYVHD
ncbi:hypothetical protein [Desulfofustis glycolicus]|uniref:Uncharacterized protein n=1 Tax=Desulfofustis glycolicus DSM 9705 TaxID=1121409 RepID=A0A1M5X3L8_9BACT|nr:hypothetical protein [Desulfofustis glycolicus]MCB2215595.1 hypothetical protein [Desulfobulbaceae bacterium]SHH94104.1 hypothetical protein SAMN02745124_02719 [Desulfofustis glycolicus DSM 9705]